MNSRVVLVTGGAGFIGANLCSRLVRSESISEVRVIDDLSSGRRSNLDELDISFFEGSVLDRSLVERVSAGCDSIVHLAAVPSVPRSIADPMRSHDVNVTGTVVVLESARSLGNMHVILASSSSVYGANPALPKTENLYCMPMSPYAVSKLAAESYALAYGECYGSPVLPFRFFNVFGPLQSAGHAYAAVVPAFVDAALSRQPLPIHGDGTQSRDFTFVDTVTAILHDAILRRVTSKGPVNLAFGTRTTLLELIEVIQVVLDRPVERDHKPPRAGDVLHSQADHTRLTELFPDIRATDLETGLRETIRWFRSQSTPGQRI